MYDDFARFSAKVAARYKGKVNAWEIWNEPNETRFWRPAPDPAGYARLLNLTYEAIKQVNPAATVILGGLSTHCANSADYMTWRTFMDGFYRAGGARFDAFAIHPYYANNRPMHPVGVQPLLQPADDEVLPERARRRRRQDLDHRVRRQDRYRHPEVQAERLQGGARPGGQVGLGGADVRVRLDGLPRGGLRLHLLLGSQRPLRQRQGVARDAAVLRAITRRVTAPGAWDRQAA